MMIANEEDIKTQSILIVDDDSTFRAFIAELLNNRGLNVLQARSAKDATNIVNNTKPVLAIVDYRLPEEDGFSWIAKMREMGHTFPIVFLSASWCDEKTFSRLRNLLRVSLILQKPIVANLFIQQIEGLLPSHLLLQTPASMDIVQQPRRPGIFSDTSSRLPAVPAAVPSWHPSLASVVNHQSSASSDKQAKLAKVKERYAAELHNHWAELTKAVNQAKESSSDAVAIREARSIAHKLRGTAGSVGFLEIGDRAGKIEDMLQHLDPTDPMQEVIWPEIFRRLAEGELLVREAQGKSEPKEESSLPPTKSVLIWGDPEHFSTLETNRGLDVYVCSALDQVLEGLKQDNCTGVLIDLSFGDPRELFSGARKIRSAHPSCLPLGCILPKDKIGKEDLVLAGFSVVLPNGADAGAVEKACEKLSAVEPSARPRILTVDDDNVLTNFIQNILGMEGMTVNALNQPINILTALEQHKPELVLLDVMMPGLSGYDVCRMLRADPAWKHLAVVFLTSRSDAEGRAAAFQAGGDDFLSKPILAEELVARVHAQVDRVRREYSQGAENMHGTIGGTEFVREGEAMLKRCKEEETKATLGLLFINESFQMNVEHGLTAATQCLMRLAKLATEHFRADVLRGRIGGEGLALLFPDEDKETVGRALEKLLHEYKQTPITTELKETFTPSFTFGLAECPDDGPSVHKLLTEANQRLVGAQRQATGAKN